MQAKVPWSEEEQVLTSMFELTITYAIDLDVRL